MGRVAQSFFNLGPRDRAEHHRVSTPLELLFDLAIVVAIASAAAGLHHAIADAHAAEGVVAFALAFFAIWWAWMNYTWFASAYDSGGSWFRILTMLVILGALLVAAGVPALFAAKPFFLMWLGYLVMRFAQVMLWLAAARGIRNVGQPHSGMLSGSRSLKFIGRSCSYGCRSARPCSSWRGLSE